MAPMPAYEIATRQEIESIFARTSELLDKLLDEDDEAEKDGTEDDEPEIGEGRSRGIALALEGLRFCCVAAEALRDTTLADVAFDAHSTLHRFDPHPSGHHHRANRAITALLDAGLAVDGRVRELAVDEDSDVRAGVAAGLSAADPPSRALLEKLSTDPVPEVRDAAKKSLSSVSEVPWWSGKWKTDPAARLLPEERHEAGLALRQVSALRDLPSYELFKKGSTKLQELETHLAALPDAIAVEAIELMCRGCDGFELGQMSGLIVRMANATGGAEAVMALVAVWGPSHLGGLAGDTLSKALRGASREARLAIARSCIECASSSSVKDRGFRTTALMAASLAGELWPVEEDISFVLDALLSDALYSGGKSTDYVRSQVADALRLEGVDPTPVKERLIEARLAGYPGAWRDIGSKADALLERLPAPALREVAERALDAEANATVTWALEQLLGPAYDANRDGTREDRVRAFLDHPRTRALVVANADLTDRALGVLRSMLAGDQLTYPEVVATFSSIDRLYGGLASRPREDDEREAARLETQQREAREAVADFFNPDRPSGPPSEQEWEALSRARENHHESDPRVRVSQWSNTLRVGPWTPYEQAELETYLALCRNVEGGGDTSDKLVVLNVATAVASKPTIELAPILDELIALAPKGARPYLRMIRADVRKFLGLKPPPKADADARAKSLPGGEWDEDEDEDEDDALDEDERE